MRRSILSGFARATLFLAASLTAGCFSASASPATANDGSGPPLTVSQAATHLAAARCSHEAACDQVGAGRAYATSEACFEDLARSVQLDLAPRACPAGIEPRRMGTCVAMVKQESCDTLSPLARYYACSPISLCVKPGAESFTTEDAYGD